MLIILELEQFMVHLLLEDVYKVLNNNCIKDRHFICAIGYRYSCRNVKI